MILPRYPVYIPSKGRADFSYTARCLVKDGVPFFLVVEPQEEEAYRAKFPDGTILVLPESNQGLIYVRNWIKAHATASGALRHWQIDDNVTYFVRLWKKKRIQVSAGVALAAAEDFTDRFTNVAIAGLQYTMFMGPQNGFRGAPPFRRNVHVYSCTLVLNSIPYTWRSRYNDDTDMCLQVLAGGWCTLCINAFMINKLWTMQVPGGNTADLYQGDGRLKMARSLERLWPGVVETKRRFQRPQHMIKDQWTKFDTPLQLRPDLDLASLPAVDEYGMELRVKADVKSPSLRRFLTEQGVELPSPTAPNP